MTRPNAMIIENGYATLAVDDYIGVNIIETTFLDEGHYVRIDDGGQYPQLCEGGKRRGNTLIYRGDASFARDCDARLFKTRKGFDAAVARMGD